MDKISQEALKKHLKYDPETGQFVRLVGIPGSPAGAVMGTISSDGYRVIAINKHRYTAGRLAWLYVYGYLPEFFVDHKDGDRGNNRIANLREATPAQNSQNQKAPKHNTSGVVGVRWNAVIGKWTASISVNGKDVHLGRFDEKDEAIAARAEAKAGMHTFNPVVRCQHATANFA